MAAPNR